MHETLMDIAKRIETAEFRFEDAMEVFNYGYVEIAEDDQHLFSLFSVVQRELEADIKLLNELVKDIFKLMREQHQQETAAHENKNHSCTR